MPFIPFFIGFLVFLGWEGPLAIYLAVLRGSRTEVIAGLLITLFFWGAFGWWPLAEAIKLMLKRPR